MDIDVENYKFKHSVKIQKRFSDLDSFAHVNNATQQSYIDVGRADYLVNLIDYKPFYLAPQTLLVVSTKTDFFRPILPDDQVVVQTSIYHIGTKSIKMLQVIKNEDTGVIHTACDSVMVAVSIDKGVPTSIQIPDEWRKRITDIEK